MGMYELLCLLSGVVLAFAITTNGTLSGFYGAYMGAVIVHIVGTAVAYVAMKAARQPWKPESKLPLWMYCGGVIGIATTVFQNVAFGHLGATAVMALSLFGQTLTALFVDGFGILGAQKREFGKGTVIGVMISVCGVLYMLRGGGDLQSYALLLSIGSGVTAVFSRLANAQLAARTSPMGSSFTNHWVGLVGCILLLFVAERDIVGTLAVTGVPLWAYIGGAFGVLMVMLWNIAGLKVSAFRLTLLSFVGQVFAGIALDTLLGRGFSREIFIGGTFVVVGVLLNMLTDKKKA